MDDLIQRQAVNTLVDELARAISDERCCISRGRSTATIMQNILDLENVIKALPSVKPQEPKWIPVRKESPVAFEKVLVTYRLHYDDSIHVGIGNTTSNVNGRYYWCLDEQDYKTWDILAWMPLPKPYDPQERSK